MDPCIAVVTGANRGLGLEFVRQLLARGDRVLAACRQPGKASSLNALAGDHPGRLHVLPLDVANEASRTAFARELALVLDDDARIDLMVNNAGALHSGERWGQVRESALDDSFRTNAIGPFLLTQALAPRLADACPEQGRRGGKVAFVSTVMASIGTRREFRSPSYCASKAALDMLAVQAAHALAARGIAVALLHPGWAQTDMGGDGADVTAADSVAGLLRQVDATDASKPLQLRDWRGETIAW
ncbi:SDR family oxidoreductase [Pseudoluteimonas lycopersici]|uniref:SDR family oxidoreductase n=1 Tax=Pseudoluteimonas lycopersici TaxID=1324796 RepID=A0A516V602_9GAMM|nr:SDR family oxidoreductase [Lysobacter lycopersici]QDQ73958.1 SDR family oxidoreductase [Lysobacter lycopersici]